MRYIFKDSVLYLETINEIDKVINISVKAHSDDKYENLIIIDNMSNQLLKSYYKELVNLKKKNHIIILFVSEEKLNGLDSFNLVYYQLLPFSDCNISFEFVTARLNTLRISSKNHDSRENNVSTTYIEMPCIPFSSKKKLSFKEIILPSKGFHLAKGFPGLLIDFAKKLIDMHDNIELLENYDDNSSNNKENSVGEHDSPSNNEESDSEIPFEYNNEEEKNEKRKYKYYDRKLTYKKLCALKAAFRKEYRSVASPRKYSHCISNCRSEEEKLLPKVTSHLTQTPTMLPNKDPVPLAEIPSLTLAASAPIESCTLIKKRSFLTLGYENTQDNNGCFISEDGIKSGKNQEEQKYDISNLADICKVKSNESQLNESFGEIKKNSRRFRGIKPKEDQEATNSGELSPKLKSDKIAEELKGADDNENEELELSNIKTGKQSRKKKVQNPKRIYEKNNFIKKMILNKRKGTVLIKYEKISKKKGKKKIRNKYVDQNSDGEDSENCINWNYDED